MNRQSSNEGRNGRVYKVCHCGSGKLPGIMRVDLPWKRGEPSQWCCATCHNDFKQCPGESMSKENAQIHQAFSKVWHESVLGVAYRTAREVLIGLPEYSSLEVDAYLNGAQDGALGDRFRLDMLEKKGQ